MTEKQTFLPGDVVERVGDPVMGIMRGDRLPVERVGEGGDDWANAGRLLFADRPSRRLPPPWLQAYREAIEMTRTLSLAALLCLFWGL